MGRIEAGSYIWRVREARGLSRDDVAAYVRAYTDTKTNSVQILKIERGANSSAVTLMAVARCVQANLEHLQQLLLDETVTVETAQLLADTWVGGAPRMVEEIPLTAEQEEQFRRITAATASDDLAHLLDELRIELQKDSSNQLLAALRGMIVGWRAKS
jgi:transcriptional regulator with XRE-family HTH domain